MWKKFSLNIQNIKHETEKAILIAMPHNSEYDGFQFWVSKKLVRAGSNSYELSVSVSDSMKFNLKRISEKTFRILEERTIDADTLIEVFGEYRFFQKTQNDKVITRVPEKLTPVKVEADAALIR